MSVDSPARPAIPDPAPWLADPAKGPRDRKGSRLALRNWRAAWGEVRLIPPPPEGGAGLAGPRGAGPARPPRQPGRVPPPAAPRPAVHRPRPAPGADRD